MAADELVGEPKANLCFTTAINGFSAWNRGEGVVLVRGVDERFLVTFAGPCLPARDAQAVGIGSGPAGSGCIAQGDQLFFSRSPLGTPRPTPFDQGFCRIRSIYAYGPDKDAVEQEPL